MHHTLSLIDLTDGTTFIYWNWKGAVDKKYAWAPSPSGVWLEIGRETKTL